MLDKTYRPAEVEAKHLRRVGGIGRLRADPAATRSPTASCCRRPT